MWYLVKFQTDDVIKSVIALGRIGKSRVCDIFPDIDSIIVPAFVQETGVISHPAMMDELDTRQSPVEVVWVNE